MIHLVKLVMILMWVAGWVISTGFWSTLVSIIFPPWGWYLTVELLVNKFLM